jgi:hypothetical protein
MIAVWREWEGKVSTTRSYKQCPETETQRFKRSTELVTQLEKGNSREPLETIATPGSFLL